MQRKRAPKIIEDVVMKMPTSRNGGSFAFVASLFVVGAVVVGVAVVIGKSDVGQINVASTIQESNKIAAENGTEQIQVASEKFQNLPNGGLIPSDNQTAQDTPLVETSATTSNAGATTTESENENTQTTGEGTETATE